MNSQSFRQVSLIETKQSSKSLGNGLWQTEVSLPSLRCGGCVSKVTKALEASSDVHSCRVNLTERRASVEWQEPPGNSHHQSKVAFFNVLNDVGHPGTVVEPLQLDGDQDFQRLVRSLAVAGFCSANVMLFSIAVWSGAGPEFASSFHWVSAVIAFVALAYAGRVFFESAWHALRRGETNMDVPISLGVLLTFVMSLYDTIHGSEHVFFEAPVMLVFFLLIGRTLDQMMRNRAQVAVSGLAKLAPRGAMCLNESGHFEYLPLAKIKPGMLLLIRAGERVPVDGEVESGLSDIDDSLITGEQVPKAASPQTRLVAGSLNLTGSLKIRAANSAQDSYLAELLRLVRAAESGRTKYRRIADRMARWYAPAVHSLSLLGFFIWFAISADMHTALTIAVAVLIITCPCALGLAVPMVQVIAARRLMQRGVLVKDGAAMERLAQIDTVILDKTGTLTSGEMRLNPIAQGHNELLRIAGAIACHSQHPYSRALTVAAQALGESPVMDGVIEVPGCGLSVTYDNIEYRLGKRDWALPNRTNRDYESTAAGVTLSANDQELTHFEFTDPVRTDAREAIQRMRAMGLEVRILSGDSHSLVQQVAQQVDISDFHGDVSPANKVAELNLCSERGLKTLMVGDGLNDVPALSAAHASMAPESAADVGRNAADLVYLSSKLTAVAFAVEVARQSNQLIHQNFALAIGYNIVAVPAALFGLVTPLIAALAMSLSSIVVIANSLRVNRQVVSPGIRSLKSANSQLRRLNETSEVRA